MEVTRQHLIDPASCFRCNTCESVCAAGAISHRTNYAVDHARCTGCGDCVADCPTGAIDHWVTVATSAVFSVDEQFTWAELPPIPELPVDVQPAAHPDVHQASVAPSSAPRPRVNLFDVHAPAAATIVRNERITDPSMDSDVHHLVLRFDGTEFPVLEGQTLGIIAPGLDAEGRAHFPRAYSVASERDGEAPGTRDVALTVKRVTAADSGGAPGVASNYLCDLAVGAIVQVVGPFGTSFLMPDDARSKLLMFCTGTGVAPMRSMIQRRVRHWSPTPGSMTLFYGARTSAEMPYHDDLQRLAGNALELHVALSRDPRAPRRYVQDLIRTEAPRIAERLLDEHTNVYLCGLRTMEAGVESALDEVCKTYGVSWTATATRLRAQGRLHVETY